MNILDNLKIDEKILLKQNQNSEFYLTNYRLILHNDKPDYIKLYSKNIHQYGEVFEDYILLELEYLKLIILDDYIYGPEAYLYLGKGSNEGEFSKMKRNIKRKRIKFKTDIEIGIGFESFHIQNQFLLNIINLKPDIIIGGFP
jgi:hypothetical protein